MQNREVKHTRQIVDWFVTVWESPMPAATQQKVELLLLDNIGNSLIGGTSELGADVGRFVASLRSTGDADIIGSAVGSSAPSAAFANAVLASAFDFDEGYHIAAYSVAASLAAGQSAGASGAQLLQAIAAAYEFGENLRLAADADRHSGGGITNAGWYHVGVVGPLVSALCAGALLGLSREELVHAVGIAANSSGGIRANFGSGAKQLQPGLAARAGVEAALLAQFGVTGFDDALSGELGLEAAFSPGGSWDWSRFDGWSWERGALAKDLAIRKYPACAPAQPAVDAVLRLRRAPGFDPGDVAGILADPRPFSLRTPEARNESELGFSLPYLLAIAAVDGTVGVEQLRASNLTRPEVRRIMTTVSAPESPSNGKGGATVQIRLIGGEVLEEPERPITYLTETVQIKEKFFRSAGEVAGAQVGEDIAAWVFALVDAPSILTTPLGLAERADAVR